MNWHGLKLAGIKLTGAVFTTPISRGMASTMSRRVDFIAGNLVVVGVRQLLVGGLVYLYLVTIWYLVCLCVEGVTNNAYKNVLFRASTLCRLAVALMRECNDS